MQYLKVQWIHEFEDEPALICPEYDDEGWETRKTEVYRDGRYGYATEVYLSL